MSYSVRNWRKFQHYKHRNPPWIKFHVKLLNDPEWFALSDSASRMLASCWLLASEHDGKLPPLKIIAFRLHMTEKRAEELISQLGQWLDNECKHDASAVLAECVHDAAPEYRVQSKKDIAQTAFERFWKAYPRRVGKKVAEKALAKALRETSIETITEALARQASLWTDPKFIPHPATWLNAGRWADDVGHVNGSPQRTFTPEEIEAGREWYRRKQAEAAE